MKCMNQETKFFDVGRFFEIASVKRNLTNSRNVYEISDSF